MYSMMKNQYLICTLVIFTVLLLRNVTSNDSYYRGFVQTTGTQFIVDGRPVYTNGFNAYWLMYMASDPSDRSKVSDTFVEASKLGVNVIRTWAFSDGGYRPLQVSPGSYNEQMFKVFTNYICHSTSSFENRI
jgi:mannan endo-1,4-beta-mannosidase